MCKEYEEAGRDVQEKGRMENSTIIYTYSDSVCSKFTTKPATTADDKCQ